MVTEKQFGMYNAYVKSHKENVVKAYNWFKVNIPEMFTEELISKLETQILSHDASKDSEEELIPYAEYFYGEKGSDGKVSDEVKEKFDKAWLHHIHCNPHHWQHWVLINDDEGTIALEIPMEYVIEMLCDWWSFSWKSNSLSEVFKWYEEHKPNMMMHKNTVKVVEGILEKIKEKIK